MQSKRKAGLLVVALGTLGLAGFAAVRLARPNRVVVVNRSGGDVRQVTLTLKPLDGSEPIARSYGVIAAGESEQIAHAFNDSSAILEFLDGHGSPRRIETPYIDLWTGQGWSFTLRADGVVEQGFDDPSVAPR